MSATVSGDKVKLLDVLVADVQDEIGVQMPEEIRSSLLGSPFFNSIFREIRFQSVKL